MLNEEKIEMTEISCLGSGVDGGAINTERNIRCIADWEQ